MNLERMVLSGWGALSSHQLLNTQVGDRKGMWPVKFCAIYRQMFVYETIAVKIKAAVG